jgi:hypothetical protein
LLWGNSLIASANASTPVAGTGRGHANRTNNAATARLTKKVLKKRMIDLDGDI